MGRKSIYIVGGVIVLVLVAIVAIPLFINANKFKPQIEAAADSALGRRVTIGNLHLALFSRGVTADNIAISEDPKYGSGSFLTAKSLEVGVEMLPLIFSREVHVRNLTIDQPQVTLLRGTGGAWNFSSLGPQDAANSSSASPSSGLSAQKIEIKNGNLIVGDMVPNAKRHEYDGVDLTASDLSYTSQFPFKFSATTPGNGSIKLSGQAGPLNQTDAAQTPLQANLQVHGLDLNSTGFVVPSSGIAGVLDFTGSLSSNGQTADSKGTITANKLKLVPAGSPAMQPVQVNYAISYDLKPQTGTLQLGEVRIGAAVMHLTGTFNNSGNTPSVAMKANGTSMPAADLQSVLPAVGVALPSGASLKGGTMDANLTISGPVDKLVTIGPVKLSNATLTGFNLGEKLGALSSFAGVPKGSDTMIQMFSSDLRVAPEGIRAANVNLVVPSIGSITGSGTIGVDQKLNFDMVAHLSASNGAVAALSGVSSIVGGGQKGGAGIPFKIEGTTSQPLFFPNLGAVAGNLSKDLAGSVPAAGQGLEGVGSQLGGLLGKK